MKCPPFTLFPCLSSLLCNLLCLLLLEPLQLPRTSVSTSTNLPILPLFHVSLYLMLISFSFLCWLISHISVLCYFSGCFRSLTYTCDLPVYLQVASYHFSDSGRISRQHTSISSLPASVLLLSYFACLHVVNPTYIVIIFA